MCKQIAITTCSAYQIKRKLLSNHRRNEGELKDIFHSAGCCSEVSPAELRLAINSTLVLSDTMELIYRSFLKRDKNLILTEVHSGKIS